jgi:Na+-driven multidrug efflux pump
MFLNSALIGFGQGFQPVCGFNYGAGLKKRVTDAFFFCVKLGTGVLVVVSALVIGFAPQIIGQFSAGSAEVADIGITALRFQAFVFCLNPFIVLSNMLLQTIRKPVRATVLALARQGLAYIPLVLILPHFLGISGIELAQPIADVLTFMLTAVIQRKILFVELKC